MIHQFHSLERALIDTASLIYLSKIRLLHICSQTIRLMTIPEVAAEFGLPGDLEPIKVVEIEWKMGESADPDQETDQRLLRAADFLRLPVISEDKQVLMEAKRRGLPYFNTLMIMNFLIFKKAIDGKIYETALEILQKKAYYSAFVFNFGQRVYTHLTNTLI